jgi:malonyl-CoA/methylmalonyl-CoA synthetase
VTTYPQIGEPLQLPHQSLVGAVRHHAATRPEAIAFLAAAGVVSVAEPADASWTWSGVERAMHRAARALIDRGVQPGDRVALSCEPSVQTVVVYLGILASGAVVVPANTAYTEREVAHIVADAAPVAAVVDDAGRASRWRATHVVEPADLLAANTGVSDAAADSMVEPSPDAAAMVGYTSGTTGAPKGAVLTHRNLAAGAASVVQAWEWSDADVLVLALPLFHMHGLGVGVGGTVLSGSTCVVLPRFAPDDVAEAIGRHEATLFFGVPTMYARLAESPRVVELSQVRLAVSGSAPLPPAIWQRLHDAAGIDVLERYGMTETVMLAANPLRGERRAGTVGRALPGVRIRLADDGVVEVAGPNVFGEYLGRPEATAAAFTADGWFRTGDIGQFDDDGYLRLVGRSSELIITGGYNVYPREIEDVLRTHPEVRDVAVVGVPDLEWGEVVAAFVVRHDAPSTGDDWTEPLVALADRELARFKQPRRWFAVDELPRNAMGKVMRADLVARATTR